MEVETVNRNCRDFPTEKDGGNRDKTISGTITAN